MSRKKSKIFSPNSVVEFYNGIVKKTLKGNISREKKQRFYRECKILQQLNESKIDNVIQYIEINVDDNPPWYTMEHHEGDSNELLSVYQGSVLKTVESILPVIETLQIIFHEYGIIHRDLKPENILFSKMSGDVKLIIADFGCALFEDESLPRVTPDYRSVGAMNFRAPEYQHGRVSNFTEKGDIFSIGKLLWYYVNGIKHEVFPYTLWFPREYDLTKRFPGREGVNKLNLIIGGCCDHEASNRLNYPSLVEALKSLVLTPKTTTNENSRLNAEKYNQRIKIDSQQKISTARSLLGVFLEDTKRAIDGLEAVFGSTSQIQNIESNYGLFQTENQILITVVKRESDCPLWNFQMENFHVLSRFHPPTSAKHFKIEDLQHPFIDINIRVQNLHGMEKAISLVWYFDKTNKLHQKFNGKIQQHDPNSTFVMMIECLNYCFET